MRHQVRASRRKHHIIYKTTCIPTGRYYVGLHSTDDLNDSYLGSGLRLLRSVKKYGAGAHQREILEILPTREAASNREKELITEEMRADPECLNCGAGGLGAVDRPPSSEDTRKKLSKAGITRWESDRAKLKADLDTELSAFSMTREEVLRVLIQADGKLSKNATRALLKLQANNLAGQRDMAGLAKRERMVHAKYVFILSLLQNPKFKDNLVEQIDAYVYERDERPMCKVCSSPVSFFRFGEPYGIYCGARCQMLGNNIRWKK